METKTSFINPAKARSDQASKFPAEEDPGVDQDQSDGQQEEAHNRVARSGGRSDTPNDPIAAFNSEPPTVLVMNFIR